MIISAHPAGIFILAFVLQCAAALAGDTARRHWRALEESERKDFATILPASLTLLALIIGFSFSMAAGRYDQRKTLEENEANAIGTEYVRAELFPAQAAQIQALLRQYTASRIAFYEAGDPTQLRQIDAATLQLQAQLWEAVAKPAIAAPTPVAALVASGMNDALNSAGYTQAMWWNRLPPGAWALLLLVATACNFLFGYSEHRAARLRLVVLPMIVAVALFLIADIDSPRSGVIRVTPQNLLALQATLP